MVVCYKHEQGIHEPFNRNVTGNIVKVLTKYVIFCLQENNDSLNLSYEVTTVPNKCMYGTLPLGIFMGYSGLVTLQEVLRKVIRSNFSKVDSTAFKQMLQHGSSLIYLGNLLGRFCHPHLFYMFSPRGRVTLSYFLMGLACLSLVFFYMIFKQTNLLVLYLCYALGGLAVGTFESNLLTCLTPLGEQVKKLSVVSIPFGFNIISIVGFLLVCKGIFHV